MLFYPRTPEEKPEQLIYELGVFQFKLIVDEARANNFELFERLEPKRPLEIAFSSELRFYDARSFQNGTIALYSTTGQWAKNDSDPVQ